MNRLEKAHKIPQLRAHMHAHESSDLQVALAPAAGHGIGKAVFNELLARPGFITLLADRAIEGLDAMSPRRWDKEKQEWIHDPDYRVRAQVLFALWAQAEGEPIKRIIKEEINSRQGVSFDIQLEESPALRAEMKRRIEKAEWRTSGNQAHKRPVKAAPVVEIEE